MGIDDGIDMGIDDGTDGGIDMGIDDGSGDDFMGSFDPMPESDVVQDVPDVENGDLNGGINMVDENEDFMGADVSGLNIEDNIDDPIGGQMDRLTWWMIQTMTIQLIW